VVARDAFLDDALLDARDAVAPAPPVGELAAYRCAGEDRILVVRFELLLERADIELELLVAVQELGLHELRVQVVAEPGGRAAANADYGCKQVELLGVAEQVAIAPGHFSACAEVGRKGGRETNDVLQALLDIERDRYAALGVERLTRPHAHARENA